ncbi:hypothetical protein FQR65_LT02427 [Abscondita terminalis]|nr:hypothetical protein FQR65_LT02427 [Abscondita terminalis]
MLSKPFKTLEETMKYLFSKEIEALPDLVDELTDEEDVDDNVLSVATVIDVAGMLEVNIKKEFDNKDDNPLSEFVLNPSNLQSAKKRKTEQSVPDHILKFTGQLPHAGVAGEDLLDVMAAHLLCIASNSGLPVFTRKKGNTESLPFSVMGSLNGVHMFGKSQKLKLLNSLMDDYCTVWKEFHDSIILIGISSGCTIQIMTNLLESAFSAMVLIVGIEKIKAQRNNERLKRDLRLCYPLIDRLMDSLDFGGPTNKYSSDLMNMSESILCNENHMLQSALEAYTECIDSEYSCILIQGKIAVATESWWSMHPDEIKLLTLLASVDNTTSSKDVPVFLPHRSPNVAYRFVACMLIPHVQVCCLCGSTPPIKDIEFSASQCFKSTLEVFELALQCHPRNIPSSLQLEAGVLGILLVNIKHGKYVISRNPNTSSNKSTSNVSHRSEILRTFFYQAVLNMIPNEKERSKVLSLSKTNLNVQDKTKKASKPSKKDIVTISKETYWCSEYHKCHALINDNNILCVLFTSTIPTHTMRLITTESLRILTADKQFCW